LEDYRLRKPICVNQFEHMGLPCAVVEITFESGQPQLRGYVGLTKRHPHFKKKIKDLKGIQLASGLTIAGDTQPIFGRTPEMWWLGFEYESQDDGDCVQTFVQKQCRELAEQLARVDDRAIAPIRFAQ
jgi:hypothetical protein